ncbi:MAG: DUF3307 domain-containing protein [bacterium]
MIETFAALLFAHTVADFLVQTNWMVTQKRRPVAMAAHLGLVLVMAVLATGSLGGAVWLVAVLHLGIDFTKTFVGQKGIAPFLLDQAAHLVSLLIVAWLFPTTWAGGLWASHDLLPPLMVLAAGLILATRAGGFAVGLLMEQWASASPRGLAGGGRAIGNLERGLIFVLIFSGQASSIGFLIAAKSVLRFGTVGDDRAISEYVIIGTLASFGWAMAVTFVTIVMLSHMTPLGIPDLTP